MLDWDDVVAAPEPFETALAFVRSAFLHACAVCGWARELPASTQGDPPPLR